MKCCQKRTSVSCTCGRNGRFLQPLRVNSRKRQDNTKGARLLSISPEHTLHTLFPTVFSDDAVCSGRGPPAIGHSHGVYATVFSAVTINQKRHFLLLHVHANVGSQRSTLQAFASTRGQRDFPRRDSGLGLPFPAYHGDLLQGSILHPSPQNDTFPGDYMHRLFVEDVERHAQEPAGHWGQRLACVIFIILGPAVQDDSALTSRLSDWVLLFGERLMKPTCYFVSVLRVMNIRACCLSEMIHGAQPSCIMKYSSNHINILKSLSELQWIEWAFEHWPQGVFILHGAGAW